jgi:hypothetical protein
VARGRPKVAAFLAPTHTRQKGSQWRYQLTNRIQLSVVQKRHWLVRKLPNALARLTTASHGSSISENGTVVEIHT